MTILARLLAPRAAAPGPIDDFWYAPVGSLTATGVRMSADTALTIATVWACVRVIANTVAMLPLIMYRRRSDGGKDRATEHPLYDLLHDNPNPRQTSFQFREMLMGHLLLRGNAYAHIVPGPRGFADQLVPLHPDRMEPQLLANGRVRYQYSTPSGPIETFNQDDIFHLSTLSDDGVKGLSVIGLARESFALAYATESYGARFFGQGARPGGVLKHPGKLSPAAHEHLRTSWTERYGGLQGSHKPAILEEGMEWQALGMSNEDSQFLQTRGFQVEELASWFGVPLSLIQHTEKSTSWGSGLTQLTQGFITYTVSPFLVRWEQAIKQKLILAPQVYFAEFLTDGMLRGDPAQRSAFYAIMVQNGLMTGNEVRIRENMNPLPGLDEPRVPLNMGPAEGQPAPAPVLVPEREEPRPENAHYRALVLEAAGRVVRREAAALETLATRHAGDIVGWRTGLAEWYAKHKAYVASAMKISSLDSSAWCDRQCAALVNGIAPMDATWEESRARELAEIATGGK